EGLKLGDFVALPRDGKPVITWRILDEAFDDGVGALRDLILRERVGGAGQKSQPIGASSAQVDTPPRSPTATRRRGKPLGGKPSLKLPRKFTDLDRDTFVDDAFEVIALAFKERLTALQEENEGVDVRFQRIDAHCFTAGIYLHGT